MDFKERCLLRAYRLLQDRAHYYFTQYQDLSRATAYQSAADILRYAMEENWEALNQYDYYNEDVTEEWACTPAAVAKEYEVTQ